ncbi:General substrate transporter [Macrophomina phaseolina MS6]|uniref:General substrate transporter n=1 Tax=Macrophomina phaseolina (strain MS6) TaxID=1126212 RepID=K2RQ55_MACPH|nr:General substrate transporter [Macrophomina phaseolina MS6]
MSRYIAEISPPSIRGRLVGFFEIGLQASQMCGFWVNYAVNRTISPQGMRQWQVPLGLQLLPGFIMMILLPLCPETPRWLCKKNRFEEAERVLCHLRQLPASHAYIVHEMHEIREDVMAKINGKALPFKAQCKELFKKGIRNRVGIGLALMM